MSMDYIRDTYRVPAKRGGKVIYHGEGQPQHGTITGTHGAHLLIVLDGEATPRKFHPTWCLHYQNEQQEPRHD